MGCDVCVSCLISIVASSLDIYTRSHCRVLITVEVSSSTIVLHGVYPSNVLLHGTPTARSQCLQAPRKLSTGCLVGGPSQPKSSPEAEITLLLSESPKDPIIHRPGPSPRRSTEDRTNIINPTRIFIRSASETDEYSHSIRQRSSPQPNPSVTRPWFGRFGQQQQTPSQHFTPIFPVQ